MYILFTAKGETFCLLRLFRILTRQNLGSVERKKKSHATSPTSYLDSLWVPQRFQVAKNRPKQIHEFFSSNFQQIFW